MPDSPDPPSVRDDDGYRRLFVGHPAPMAVWDPETGRILEHNMPELYAPNGYFYTLGAMILIALIQLVWFWQKGWLRK